MFLKSAPKRVSGRSDIPDFQDGKPPAGVLENLHVASLGAAITVDHGEFVNRSRTTG